MAKIALACTFRHYEDDGDTIPASLTRQDPVCEWETVVDPIIGFMAVLHLGRVSWSFIKYEAPDERHQKGSKTPIRKMARFSTARVGYLTCPECRAKTLYPVWGSPDKTRCPECGKKGVSIDYVKETSPEFFKLLGELKEPLEDAVRSVDPDTANEFHFPNLMLLGRLDPSENVLPALQGKAAERGLTLRLASETDPDDLFGDDRMAGDDTGLLIEPGIFIGSLDEKQAREGWSFEQGLLQEYVKLPWLPQTPVSHRRFGGARL